MKAQLKFAYRSILTSLFALGICSSAAFAQPEKQVVTTDTTEIIIGKKVIVIVKDSTEEKNINISKHIVVEDTTKDEFHRVEVSPIGIDLGANFLSNNGNFNLPSGQDDYEIQPLRSTHLGLHVLPTRFNFGRGHVSLLTALTFDNNRYQFNNNVRPMPGLDSLVMSTDSISFEKNKLVTWYAQVPLMLSFQTNPEDDKKNFHFSVGGYAGMFLGAKFKEKTLERGKVNFSDDFNLNRLRYGVSARIGFRGLEFYANYQLSSLFTEGEGPNLNPLNVGIALTGFM